MSDAPDDSVKDLLGRLDDAGHNEYAHGSFQARALSKGRDSINFAISSGIVAVPVEAITSLRQIEGRGPDELWVDVSDLASLKQLRPFPDDFNPPRPFPRPRPGPEPLPDPLFDPTDPFGADAGTQTRNRVCNGIDTTCASGGVADQTDDYRESCYTEID